MSERTKSIIERIVVPCMLGAALLSVSIWGAGRNAQAETYKGTTQAIYTRAFTELCATFDELTATLGKLLAVTSPAQTVLLLDDVWRLSGAGESLMAQLPQSHVDTEGMNRFIIQLGDYARALTKKAVRGIAMTEEDRKQLSDLYASCAALSSELQARLSEGDIPLAVVTAEGYYATAAQSDGAMASSGTVDAQGDYKDAESIEQFPTLIYDGPFSESTEKQTPRGLRGEAVDEAAARRIAEKAAGVVLPTAAYSAGRIPSYDFSGTDENGGGIEVAVAAQSGQIVWLMGTASSSLEGKPPLSETKRYKSLAIQYLSDMGYPDMQATYAQYYGGCALINCAATQNGALLYSDLIKVWVDRETLKIVGVDARNYLFSHTEREMEAPRLSMAEAEGLLSSALHVEDRALALIPLSPQTERLCYEFRCTLNGESYILYLNVEDGEEEQIFKIIDSEDGEMVL